MNQATPTQTPAVSAASETVFNVAHPHELKLSKDAEEWLRSVGPNYFQSYEQIEQLWNAPSTQFAVTCLNDTELQGAVKQIRDSHRMDQFLGYELVLILILWTFRAWRLSKMSTFFTRIWTQAWISAVYWFAAIFLIPCLVWGEAYRTVIAHLAKALFRHFLA